MEQCASASSTVPMSSLDLAELERMADFYSRERSNVRKQSLAHRRSTEVCDVSVMVPGIVCAEVRDCGPTHRNLLHAESQHSREDSSPLRVRQVRAKRACPRA